MYLNGPLAFDEVYSDPSFIAYSRLDTGRTMAEAVIETPDEESFVLTVTQAPRLGLLECVLHQLTHDGRRGRKREHFHALGLQKALGRAFLEVA